MALITSYDGSTDGTTVLRNGNYTRYGETFLCPSANSYTVTSCKFYLDKTGSPTGSAYATLYATDGTTPTGAALATSNAVDVSILDGTLRELTFSTPATMTPGSRYAINMEYTGGDGSNYISQTFDSTTPSYEGRLCRYISSWATVTVWDINFFVYGDIASSIKTINGLAKASVKTLNGLAIASVKSINGLT